MKRKRSGIFAQIFASFAAICAFVVLLCGSISFFIVRGALVNETITDLSSKAWTLSQIASQPSGLLRMLNDDRFYEMQMLTDAQMVFVDADMNAQFLSPENEYALEEEYQTEADYDVVSLRLLDSVDRAIIQRILNGERVAQVYRVKLLNGTVVLCGAPVYDTANRLEAEVCGALLLWRPITDIWMAAIQMLWSFAGAGGTATLLALIIAWILSNRITHPVFSLGNAARHIAAGDYGVSSAKEYGSAELNELGLTLDTMRLRLHSVISSLSNEKSKLEQILHGIGEGIIAVDTHGTLLHRNEAVQTLLGVSFTEEDQLYRSDSDILQEISGLLEKAVHQGEQSRNAWSLPEGRQIAATVSPVFADTGTEIIGAVALLRDISEAARLEQMRRDYIANVSHELRTPLTGIRGMVEPLIDGILDSEEERQDSYRIIYQETVRLQKLIGDMLDLSRLQDGRLEISLENLNVASIIRSICERTLPRARASNVALCTEGADEEIYAIGNEDRIMQVLVILLDNAIGFSKPGGHVRIFLQKAEDHVAFGVADDGSGIDPKDLPYIWERFFKADRSRMRTSGTGLGLAIAKMVVSLMHGTIDVVSQPEQGATFTVRIPCGQEPDDR